MDRGAWRATVHGVAKSWTPLSDYAGAAYLENTSKLSYQLSENSVMLVDETIISHPITGP